MSKHTEGPLTYHRAPTPDNTGGVDYAIVDSLNKIIAETFEHVGRRDDGSRIERPAEANARLFAAAPELLFRLNRLCREVGPLTTHYEHEIRQAIGNTNFAVLKLALKEADEIAQKAEGGK